MSLLNILIQWLQFEYAFEDGPKTVRSNKDSLLHYDLLSIFRYIPHSRRPHIRQTRS